MSSYVAAAYSSTARILPKHSWDAAVWIDSSQMWLIYSYWLIHSIQMWVISFYWGLGSIQIRVSLVSDIPAGDGKIANLFFTM
jgi:hypothetical protein